MFKVIEKKVFCKNKEGKQYTDKRGKNFCRIVIKMEGNDKEYSNLAYSKEDIEAIQVNNLYDFILEKNGDFYNWRFPNKTDMLEARIKAIEDKLEMDIVAEEEIEKEETLEETPPEEELDVSDIPF